MKLPCEKMQSPGKPFGRNAIHRRALRFKMQALRPKCNPQASLALRTQEPFLVNVICLSCDYFLYLIRAWNLNYKIICNWPREWYVSPYKDGVYSKKRKKTFWIENNFPSIEKENSKVVHLVIFLTSCPTVLYHSHQSNVIYVIHFNN